MSEQRYSPEDERQFIATTYIDLTRHGSRFGGPMDVMFPDGTKLTVDDGTDLTPRGKEGAKEFGVSGYPSDVTLIHPRGGDEPRHGETGDDMMSRSEKIGLARAGLEVGPAAVRSKEGRVKGSRRCKGTDYKSAGVSDALKGAKQLINKTLNDLVTAASQSDPLFEERFKSNPELRAQYREQAQNAGLRAAMNKEEVMELLAENEAYELIHAIELSRRGVKGGEAKAIPIVGSGLFAESLYKKAMVIEDEKTGERKVGFDDVDEIGGFTKQATAFRIKLERNTRLGDARQLEDFLKDTKVEFSFTDPERANLPQLKDKKVYLDWNLVRELADKAEKRLSTKTE